MAEKILRKFQQYSKNELTQLLQKNGYDEFVEILNNGGITTGEKFLNLTELQIIKWKLPPAIKKKLMSLLQEVKRNPQNFMEESETDKPATLTRRQSLRTKSDFKEKLEQVITIPKPAEVRPVKQPAPLPKEEPIQRTPLIAKKPEAPAPKIEKERVPSPVEEYLQMDRGKQEENVQAHYDSNGYMIPVSKLEEENDYEPAPSDRIITNFIPAVPRDVSIPITRRAPLALPRDSTDERGYICGPEDLASPDQNSNDPPTFPRVYRNPRTGAFKPKVATPTSSPSSQLPPTIIVQKETENEDEEVAYEPIDDDEEPPSRRSPEPTNVDVQPGSLSRIIGFLKKGGRSPNYEQNEIRVAKVEKSDNRKPAVGYTENNAQLRKITARPLPPLPSETVFVAPKPKESNIALEEPLEVYENIHKNLSAEDLRRLHTQLSNALNSNEGFIRGEKSKSEQNLATAEEPVHYGNVEENTTPRYPKSYEQHIFNNTSAKKTIPFSLPLPPISIPQIQLEDARFPENIDHEEENGENEDYGSCIFNINDEPFYRYTDRKGAKELLSGLGDGAFLFRPSRTFFLTLSLKYQNQYYNLGIERTENNKIRLNTSGDNMSPEFATLKDFVEYFTREQITFVHKGRTIDTYLRKTLPPNIF